MSGQKFRADRCEPQGDGATLWFTDWIGGPTLAKINNCRLASLEGGMRQTVYITGDADTYFGIPAVTHIAGCRVRGYVTGDDLTDDGTRNLVFRHTYY